MRTLEAIHVMDLTIGIAAGLATIAAVFALVTWLVGRQSNERRGGLLDLTPSSDSRKNARATTVCSECGRPWGESHLGTCSLSQMRGGSGIIGVSVVESGTYREAS